MIALAWTIGGLYLGKRTGAISPLTCWAHLWCALFFCGLLLLPVPSSLSPAFETSVVVRLVPKNPADLAG